MRPRKQGTAVKVCRSDPELGADEGCMSRSGSGVIFPPPCPCLAFALELSRNITHTPSADLHIAHSSLNKREAEMENWPLRQVEKGILGMFDERASEMRLATY